VNLHPADSVEVHQAARLRRAAGLSPAQVPPIQSSHLLTNYWRFLRRGVYENFPVKGLEAAVCGARLLSYLPSVRDAVGGTDGRFLAD